MPETLHKNPVYIYALCDPDTLIVTDETKRKISEARKNFFKNNTVKRINNAEDKYHYTVLPRD